MLTFMLKQKKKIMDVIKMMKYSHDFPPPSLLNANFVAAREKTFGSSGESNQDVRSGSSPQP